MEDKFARGGTRPRLIIKDRFVALQISSRYVSFLIVIMVSYS